MKTLEETTNASRSGFWATSASSRGGQVLFFDMEEKNIAKLAMDLVRIPSISGEEMEVGNFLKDLLAKDFTIKTQKVGNRINVFAFTGRPKLMLTTHMDTVPGTPKIAEDSKFIYGRGSCDAKGAIAAMVSAALAALEGGLNDFCLLFDVDEENEFEGIKKAIKMVNPEFVVVGEPSSLKLVNGQKGLLQFDLSQKGRAAPASLPQRGLSAINKLLLDLNKIAKIKLPKNKFLGETTMNIGKINGGRAANIIPDYAYAKIDVRTSSRNSEIKQLFRKAAINGKLKTELDFEPAFNDLYDLPKLLGLKTMVASYFTEMYFWRKKANTVVFGPGDYRYAHSAFEKVSKKELLKAAEIYLEIIKLDSKGMLPSNDP